MSTEQTWQTKSTSLEEALRLAEQIGHNLRGGEVIELISDLGGGKTTFTRGLARGIGSEDAVHSPSFTISNQYTSNNLTIHHFDFYRLMEPVIMREELSEILDDPKAVAVIEWGDIVSDVLPIDRITIRISALAESERDIVIQVPKEKAYLLEFNT